MDKSGNSSDFSNLTQKILGLSDSEKSSSHKRKADEISVNQYEDTNKELRELYMQRKKMRENDKGFDQQIEKENEKVLVDLSNKTSKDIQEPVLANKKITVPEENKEEIISMIKQIVMPEKKKEEVKQEEFEEWERWEDFPDVNPLKVVDQPVVTQKNPVLWINKLRYYPGDFLLENMITFKQLMYEDLLKNSEYNFFNIIML